MPSPIQAQGGQGWNYSPEPNPVDTSAQNKGRHLALPAWEKPTSPGTSKDCRPASLQTRYGLPSSLQGGHQPRQLTQSLL